MRPPGRLRSAPPRLRTAAPHSELTCPAHSSPAMEATPPASARGRRPQATAAPASALGLDFSLPPSLPNPSPRLCWPSARDLRAFRAGESTGADLSGLRRVQAPTLPAGGAAPTCVQPGRPPTARMTLPMEEGPLQRLFLSLQPGGPQGATCTPSHYHGM